MAEKVPATEATQVQAAAQPQVQITDEVKEKKFAYVVDVISKHIEVAHLLILLTVEYDNPTIAQFQNAIKELLPDFINVVEQFEDSYATMLQDDQKR